MLLPFTSRRFVSALVVLSCAWLQPWILGSSGWGRGTLALAGTDPAFAPAPPSTNPALPVLVAAGPQDPGPRPDLDKLPYSPGRIVLKLADEPVTKAGGAEAGSRASGALGSFGIPALDDLNRRNGFRSVTRPFAARAARAKSHLSRFSQRGARAPAGASAPRLEDIYILELSPFLDMEEVARQYAAVPGVAYAEPDRKVEAILLTNDPFVTSFGSWGQPFADLWGLHVIGAPAAWDLTSGAGVVIAITDTGIDRTHPDIASQVWTNAGEIPDNGIDDDGNGYIDDDWGWDFYHDNNDPSDDHGHGTHVAGTAAASGNNGVGVVGVAWQASVMALKGLNSGGGGFFSDLAEAIVYAIDNGADLINASWGGWGGSELISDAIAAAHAAGVVFVAAAGNDRREVGDFAPANDPNAITVAAFDHTDAVAFFSNFGPKIDVAAPGGGEEEPAKMFDPIRSILSLRAAGAGGDFPDKLTVGGIYARQGGTSMAAPHVAGAAALILARHPEFSAEQVRQVLRATADDVDAPGVDANSGYGRINVGNAVLVDSALELAITAPALEELVMRSSLEIRGTVTGSGFASYSLEYGEGNYPTEWMAIAGPIPTPVVDGELALWDLSGVVDGEYVVRLLGSTTAGHVFEERVPITLDRVIITEPESYTMMRAGDPVEIRGSAAGPGFQGYTVEYRLVGPDLLEGEWVSQGIFLTGAGTAAVEEGVLAVLDSSVISEGRDVDFKVTVNTTGESATDERYHLVIEPSLRPGWPRRIPGLPSRWWRMKGHTTIADLDGDGEKEILAAYGDLVFVLRHDGSDFPGWPQSMTQADYAGFVDVAPAAADLDNDGDLEVVSANGRWVFVWHHDGTPMAGWPRQLVYEGPFGPQGWPRGLFTLADLDGDGVRDIIFAWGAALAAVRTDGSFLPGFPVEIASILLSPQPFHDALAVGDVDGDGELEIAAVERLDWGPEVLHLYDAVGQLKPRWPTKIVRRRPGDNWPIMADLNGDGMLDVVANTDRIKRLRAYRADRKKVKLRTKIPDFRWSWPGIGSFRSGQEQISAADIDGDGRAEVFVSTHWPQTRVRCHGIMCTWTWLTPPFNGTDYLLPVSSTLKEVPGWPVAFDFPRGDNAHGPGGAAIGDIDGDGGQDIVVGTGICANWDPTRGLHRCYTIYAFRTDGTLLPGFPKPTAMPGPTDSVMPAIGDLDGDGLKEIVWVDFNGNVLVWNVPGTPGPENMQWPMFRHDPAHTGALP